MADPVDIANDHIERVERARLEALRATNTGIPKGHGKCLACGSKVKGTRRWCDAECRDAWSLRGARHG